MTIKVTLAAREHILAKLKDQSGAKGFRLGLKKGGCSDFMYKPSLADAIGASDLVYEEHGLKVIIDKDDLPYLDGTTIDFKKHGFDQMLVYNNPKAEGACGCGESFKIDQSGSSPVNDQ